MEQTLSESAMRHGRTASYCRYLGRKDIYNATYKLYIIMNGRQLVKHFENHGWKLDRVRGSHHIMVKPGRRAIPIPVHGNRELPAGTLSAILRQADLRKE
jgi:predicted RNA binding protein YcfA (HicA-like mRNA interferase family)